jgi:hypothetical protein
VSSSALRIAASIPRNADVSGVRSGSRDDSATLPAGIAASGSLRKTTSAIAQLDVAYRAETRHTAADDRLLCGSGANHQSHCNADSDILSQSWRAMMRADKLPYWYAT